MRTALVLALGLTLGLLLAALGGCGDDEGEPQPIRPDWIRGQVRDPDGVPLANAAIMLTYNVSAPKPATPIEFELPDDAAVDLWVEDRCRDEHVRTIVDGVRPAGANTVTWDGRDEAGLQVLEGLYQIILHADTSGVAAIRDTTQVLYLRGTYPHEASPDTFRHHTVTNAQGYFEFSQRCLRLGEWVELTGQEEPVYIPRYVRLWALKEGYGSAVSALTEIKQNTGANVPLQVGELR
jgi:hypothetical protein